MSKIQKDDFLQYGDIEGASILYASLDEQFERRRSVIGNVGSRAKFAFVRCIDGRGWSELETESHLSKEMVERRRQEFEKGRDWLTRGAIACAVTHRSNLIDQISTQGKFLCEDDVKIEKNMLNLIGEGKLQSELEKLDGVTLLCYRSRTDIIAEKVPVFNFGKFSIHKVLPKGIGSAACYFVPSHIAKKIVSLQTPISTPVDHWDEMVAGGAFKSLYVVSPKPSRIGDFPTTIGYAYAKETKLPHFISHNTYVRRVKKKIMTLRGDFKEKITVWVDDISK